jgi:hypothetical protein
MLAADATVSDWLQLIRAEYLEFPGLHLTKPQIERLWGFDPATCEALLATLIDVRFLRRTCADTYIRDDGGSSSAGSHSNS